MIDSRLTLSGQITGFMTGDRNLELTWKIRDGVGQFERFDLANDDARIVTLGKGATLVIFVPGVAAESETPPAHQNDSVPATVSIRWIESSASQPLNAEELKKIAFYSSTAATILSVVRVDASAKYLAFQASRPLTGCEVIVL